MNESDAIQTVLHYHERTKHHLERYARSLGFLDWSAQPNPFRRYHDPVRSGPPLVVDLPLPDRDETPRFTALFNDPWDPAFRDVREISARPINLRSIGLLLFYALAVSAWKSYKNSTWALRVNPSSGNLHPTEAYLLIPGRAVPEVLPSTGENGPRTAVVHYAPDRHQVELRATLPGNLLDGLLEPADGPLGQAAGTPGPIRDLSAAGPTSKSAPATRFAIVLTSIAWREAWKYGERAFRYVQHDTGHALAALRIAAALFGWRLMVVPDAPEADLEMLLGIDRDAELLPAEREAADLIAVVDTSTSPHVAGAEWSIPAPTSAAWPLSPVTLRRGRGETHFFGRPNRLSQTHHPWPIVEEVERASRRPTAVPAGFARGEASLRRALTGHPDTPTASTPSAGSSPSGPGAAGPAPAPLPPMGKSLAAHAATQRLTAGRLIRGRRSAVSMDGTTRLDLPSLEWMLSRLLPGSALPPWDALPWRPLVHCVLFVHRVDGLEPGLYLQVRDPRDLAELREGLSDLFAWAPVSGVHANLGLYHLQSGDLQATATTLCCHQTIAGDGAFSVAFVGKFKPVLQQAGPWWYRRMLWEAGMLGQMLYLFAEAAGLRATGIGCYFDDATHRLLGTRRRTWQSLYHFTVGGGVEDPRLSTLPAYDRRGFREPGEAASASAPAR